MTGIHAVHIIGGIIAILWVVAKAAAGEFSAEYFLPVENVGLYWHLVDLVWIYLFPLMYLIH
jgi:cytochrome c oxidase subunit 3